MKIRNFVLALLCAVSLVFVVSCKKEDKEADLRKMLEKTSVGLVNEIVEENFGKTAFECVKVEIQKKKNDGSYSAIAYFDDDDETELKCVITYDEEKEYVEVHLVEQ